MISPEEQEEGQSEPSLPATRRDTSTPPGSRTGASDATLFYQGPLPPPETLRGYNELIPNAAERIFAVFEKQAAHRMNEEREERIASFKLASHLWNSAKAL